MSLAPQVSHVSQLWCWGRLWRHWHVFLGWKYMVGYRYSRTRSILRAPPPFMTSLTRIHQAEFQSCSSHQRKGCWGEDECDASLECNCSRGTSCLSVNVLDTLVANVTISYKLTQARNVMLPDWIADKCEHIVSEHTALLCCSYGDGELQVNF